MSYNNKSILEQLDFNKINCGDVRDALNIINWYELLNDTPKQKCYGTVGDMCGVLV